MTSTRYCPPGLGSSQAWPPNQRVTFSGSTRNSQTVSGLAAISSSRSIIVSVVVSTLPLLLFCLALEGAEALVQELLQEFPTLGQPFRSYPVEPPRPVASLAPEPRLLEDVQMLGNRRPGDVEVSGDLACRELAVADERQDLAAARAGDRFQCGFHGG